MADIYSRLRPPSPTPADEICSCPPGTPIMVMSALGENPIHCLNCNLEVEPGNLPLPESMVDTVAHWEWSAGAIHALELDSGAYEQWAQDQLLDVESAINREGFEVQSELNSVRRCYYVLFQQNKGADSGFVDPLHCPKCGWELTHYQGLFRRLLCERCSIALIETE